MPVLLQTLQSSHSVAELSSAKVSTVNPLAELFSSTRVVYAIVGEIGFYGIYLQLDCEVRMNVTKLVLTTDV
jgi:hypothetical protein